MIKYFLLDFLSTAKFNREDASMCQKNRYPLRAMALMSALLSQIVGSVLIGIFIGRWLDRTFDTDPLLLVVGLLLGLATGIFAMFSTVRQYF